MLNRVEVSRKSGFFVAHTALGACWLNTWKHDVEMAYQYPNSSDEYCAHAAVAQMEYVLAELKNT